MDGWMEKRMNGFAFPKPLFSWPMDWVSRLYSFFLPSPHFPTQVTPTALPEPFHACTHGVTIAREQKICIRICILDFPLA
jgi:hypothetical protein